MLPGGVTPVVLRLARRDWKKLASTSFCAPEPVGVGGTAKAEVVPFEGFDGVVGERISGV